MSHNHLPTTPNPIAPQRAIRKYDTSDYEKLGEGGQHNIMMLVGNGFDISALNMLGAEYLTTYTAFFHFLEAQNFDPDNIPFALMKQLRSKHEEALAAGKDIYCNWSDFEDALQKFLETTALPESHQTSRLNADLKQIQLAFCRFLKIVVSPDAISHLSEQAEANRWATRTFSKFLGDLDIGQHQRIKLARSFYHYHLLNVNIINFNFTPLLDNYLFLDQVQFDPHRYKVSDRNFSFFPNPQNYVYAGVSGNDETAWSSYLMTQTHHPHGEQQIPRSLLFGIDASDDIAKTGSEIKIEKAYWAQSPRKYQKLIAETELFVIFGSSLGRTDQWWWRHILAAIGQNSQVIIYKYVTNLDSTDITEDSIRDTFIRENFDSDLFQNSTLCDAAIFDHLERNILVVLYDDPTTLFAFGWSPLEASKD